MTRDDWHVALGESDPLAIYGDSGCDAFSSGAYVCTRPLEHEPPHVACNDSSVIVAIWDDVDDVDQLSQTISGTDE